MRKKLYSMAFIFMFFSVVFILGITYVSWRWVYTLNLLTSPFTTFWSYALCIAEILTLLVFTNFALILLQTNKLEKTKPDNKLQQDYSKDIFHNNELVTFQNFCPSVDVFICTLNEPADMLATTISACKNIDYPNHKVYVLDDGKREEIKELAEALGCNYITRDNNKGFKAGNINNALEKTNGEIVVIFDSDHVAASTFLRETIHYFINENVALVQTPQYFCNPDAFQKNLELPDFLSNEQDIFYRVIEPGLNQFDSVFCGGTNILLRRKHLEAVGNFPTSTITEDSLLGLIFHAKGYKVIYYNRPLAVGLSASSFEEYIKQRARWSKGNIQIVTNPKNWKYYLNLNHKQAFFYLTSILYFFTPVARIIYLLAPVFFLIFDISPLLIPFYQIFAFQISYFALKFAFMFAARIKINNVILADVYDLVTSIFTLGGIIKTILLPGKLSNIKFSVTKKDFKGDKTNYKYKLPIVLIFLMVVWAEMQGIYDIMYSDPYSVLAIVANLFWNSTNIIILYYALKAVSEKPEKRAYQRVKTNDDLIIQDSHRHKFKSHINDISRSGISLNANEDLAANHKNDLNIEIQGADNPIEILSCQKDENDEDFTCKSVFQKPIELFKVTKEYVDRLDRYVRFAYKKADKWDDYYDEKEAK